MTTIKKPYASVTLDECVKLISAVGDRVSVLIQGEVGTGKSSILKELAKLHPGHIPCYVDVTTKDVGDFMIPHIRTLDGTAVCSFIPNEEFGLHFNKPLIIMFDELGKGSRSVVNTCLPIITERRIGVNKLPEGSIVFATTNLSVEGLGDNVMAHARNRQCVVKMRKPNAEEWRWGWAVHNGIDPVIIASVAEYPSCLASFEDYERPEMNDYINDPRVPRAAFVTPRSLEKASDILKTCRGLPEDVLTHALMGVLGERFTLDLMNILKLDLTLPTFNEIITSPLTALVPANGAAVCLVISKLLTNATDKTFDAIMEYLVRLPREAQALFAMNTMSSKSPHRHIAVKNSKFTKYCVSQGYLFS